MNTLYICVWDRDDSGTTSYFHGFRIGTASALGLVEASQVWFQAAAERWMDANTSQLRCSIVHLVAICCYLLLFVACWSSGFLQFLCATPAYAEAIWPGGIYLLNANLSRENRENQENRDTKIQTEPLLKLRIPQLSEARPRRSARRQSSCTRG